MAASRRVERQGCFTGMMSCVCQCLSGKGSVLAKSRLAFKSSVAAGKLPDLDDACCVVAARGGALTRRSVTVIVKLLPVVARILVDHFLCSCCRRPWRAAENTRRLRLALEALGPAFVKLGQACAAREDILSDEVAAELRKLCDKVAPFASDLARRLLAQELGSSAPGVPEKPVAAASLGQVYCVSVDGCDYALKVQRPDLTEALALDVVILRRIAKIVRRVVSWFCVASVDVAKVVDGWALTMWHELDYKREAEASEIMRKSFLDKLPTLEIPEVCWRFTSTRVLATRWVHGKQVSRKIQGVVTQEHIRTGVEAFASMILDLGIVHADPHAGNMLVTVPEGKLCLLDFGMVIQVPLSHRKAWAKCFVSMVREDYLATLRSLEDIGFFPQGYNPAEILPIMSVLWKQLVTCGSDIKKRQVAVRECYGEILTLVRRFDFDLPDYYVALARALITLEGIAISADCEFDIFKACFPVALRAIMSSSTPVCEGTRLAVAQAAFGAFARFCTQRAVGAMRKAGTAAASAYRKQAVLVTLGAASLGAFIFVHASAKSVTG